jgi:hypothetical protein
VLEGVEKERT